MRSSNKQCAEENWYETNPRAKSFDLKTLAVVSVAKPLQVNMDELGCHLSSKLDIRLGSPAAREDRFSFFNEITQKQMANYRPDQIVTILKQRENASLISISSTRQVLSPNEH